MSFNEKLPEWLNEGTEPPQSKKNEGWQVREKPPAGWFNWLFNRAFKALQELQGKAEHTDNKGQPNGYASLDSSGNVPTEQLGNVEVPDPPVTSVNSKTGDVALSASDVGAETPDGAQAKANNALDAAKDYADGVGSSAVAAANSYTDQEVGEVAGALDKHLDESATEENLGHVIVDGETILVDENGVISATAQQANKNFIINGNFDVWQRGTSASGLNSSTMMLLADKWVGYGSGWRGVSASRQELDESSLPRQEAGARYCMRLVKAAGEQHDFGIRQRIYHPTLLSGKKVTFSCYIRASQSITALTRLRQTFAEGAVPIIHGENQIDSNWSRIFFTIEMENIDGRTVNANSYIDTIVLFSVPTEEFWFEITGVQVEEGDTATSFNRRLPEEELAMCAPVIATVAPSAFVGEGGQWQVY